MAKVLVHWIWFICLTTGKTFPVLRLKFKEKKETYISELLKGRLYESDEKFEFIDISLIWNK